MIIAVGIGPYVARRTVAHRAIQPHGHAQPQHSQHRGYAVHQSILGRRKLGPSHQSQEEIGHGTPGVGPSPAQPGQGAEQGEGVYLFIPVVPIDQHGKEGNPPFDHMRSMQQGLRQFFAIVAQIERRVKAEIAAAVPPHHRLGKGIAQR